MIQIDTSRADRFAEKKLWDQALAAQKTLLDGTGAGNDFLGWVSLPQSYDRAEFARIQAAAKKIQSQSQVLLVVGIGGSYLGARAVIELLRSNLYNQLPKTTPEIYFVGNDLSASTLQETMTLLDGRDFSINVISKSGTTTEPAVAFRVLREMMEEKYGKNGARERIYATTDRAKGALKTLADLEGYETFADRGGRD